MNSTGQLKRNRRPHRWQLMAFHFFDCDPAVFFLPINVKSGIDFIVTPAGFYLFISHISLITYPHCLFFISLISFLAASDAIHFRRATGHARSQSLGSAAIQRKVTSISLNLVSNRVNIESSQGRDIVAMTLKQHDQLKC